MEISYIELLGTILTIGALVGFLYWVRGQNQTNKDLVATLDNAVKQLGQNANEAYKQAPENQRMLINTLNAFANAFERLAFQLAPGTPIAEIADKAEDFGDLVTGEEDTEPDEEPTE